MSSTRTVDNEGNIHYRNENGRLHRTDGPAYEEPSGYKSWWINGEYHREDGPAVVYSDGDVDYYLNGKHYSKEEWEEEVIKLKLERLKEL